MDPAPTRRATVAGAPVLHGSVSDARHPFEGRTAALATQHGKAAVIAPALAPLGLAVVVAAVDTDAFGTFSGERPRVGDARTAARAKARAALATCADADYAIASEGSFGPHPALPFAAAGAELVLLLDARTGDAWWGEDVTLETTHAHADVRTLEEARAFAARVRFPSHAVVVTVPRCADDRAETGPDIVVGRGLADEAALAAAVERTLARWGVARVASDLRADRNPTRMAAVGRAADDLARRLASACPACARPGWWPVERLAGRPCAWCDAPTALARAARWTCEGCGLDETRTLDAGPAPPDACAACNP